MYRVHPLALDFACLWELIYFSSHWVRLQSSVETDTHVARAELTCTKCCCSAVLLVQCLQGSTSVVQALGQ